MAARRVAGIVRAMRMLSIASLVSSGLIATLSSCSCGPPEIFVVDNFSVDAPVDAPFTDSLHSYAAGSKVTFDLVTANIGDLAKTLGPTEVGGSFSLDTGCEEGDVDCDENDNSGSTVHVLVGDAGSGTITLVGEDGAPYGEVRTVDVKEVDDIVLAVTAPTAGGIEHPVVADSIRVFSDVEGGSSTQVAFRASLFAGGDEVFGLDVVSSSDADQTLSPGRPCLACADEGCSADRAAIEFSVPSSVTEPIDVDVKAGTAQLTVSLVPTPIADITDVVLDEGALLDAKQSVIADVVAGTEPVFGVPVIWSVDGADVKDDNDVVQTGDALQYTPGSTSHDVTATIGTFSADTAVSGDEFEVTAITFACGAAPGAAAPVAAVIALLLFRRRRR